MWGSGGRRKEFGHTCGALGSRLGCGRPRMGLCVGREALWEGPGGLGMGFLYVNWCIENKRIVPGACRQ